MIDVKNLQKHFGGLQVLRGVDLTINKGDCVVLVGPSGCGKSTFLRCLNLMNREISKCSVGGQIFYHGHDINTPKENLFELRKSIGMVFQQPTPSPAASSSASASPARSR